MTQLQINQNHLHAKDPENFHQVLLAEQSLFYYPAPRLSQVGQSRQAYALLVCLAS